MNIFQQIITYTIEYFQELGELLWLYRTRIISLFIVILILIPAFLAPPKEKNFIQSAQKNVGNLPNFTLPNINTQDLVPKPPLINIEIPKNDYAQNLEPRNSPFLSGVLDQRIDSVLTDTEKVKDILKIAKKIRYEGKVSWADNLKNSVYTDKFNVGSSIKITINNKSYIKNIDEKIIMTDDNLLLVNKDVFMEIGGDPKSQKSINVVLEQ
jgi:hypothetical protein